MGVNGWSATNNENNMSDPKSRIETQKELSEASRCRKSAGLNQRPKRRRSKGYKEMDMWGAWFELMRRQWRTHD